MAEKEMKPTNDTEKILKRDYSEDSDAHHDVINKIPVDALEAMDSAKIFDDTSQETKNGLTDSATAIIYWERACRVAGQEPEGEVKALGKRDTGKAMLMDLIRKWIYQNANAQMSFLDKMVMWVYKKSQYPFAVMHYDINLSPSGYYGPDCWLYNFRNFIPQNGVSSISDMDYVHGDAFMTKRWFEEIMEDEDSGYDQEVLKELWPRIKNATREKDTDSDTKSVRDQQTQSTRQIKVTTRYEAGDEGKWITFLPDFGCRVIRSIKNPHKNGKIPFVALFGMPSAETFYPTCDFQRSMPMQAADDGLDNYYFESIKRNLAPITAINTQTAIAHTIEQKPDAVWEFAGTPEFRVAETSNAGLSTYQAAKATVKGAIQSIAGTTDTRLNSEQTSDPGFGKTPEALQMIAARESTRDQQDRRFMESALKELIEGMLSIVPTISEKIELDLFAEDIMSIVESGNEDIMELFEETDDDRTVPNKEAKLIKQQIVDFQESDTGKQMKLKINPEKLKGMEYRFELVPNSTAKKTQEEQLKSFTDWFQFLGTIQNVVQDAQETQGIAPDLMQINKIYGSLSNIPGMDKVFMQVPPKQSEQPQPEPQPTEQPQAAQPPMEQPVAQPQVIAGRQFNHPDTAAAAAQIAGGQ